MLGFGWDLVKERKISVLLVWFRRFSVEDKTTGIDLFKLDVKCVTTYYNMTDVHRGE